MTVEASIYSLLLANGGVAALVGVRVTSQLRGETLPAITIQRISTPRLRDLQGPSGLASPRFQINSWASTYDEAKQVAEAVRAAMDGYAGTVGSYYIADANLEDEGDLLDISPGLEPKRTYAVRQDFQVWHAE